MISLNSTSLPMCSTVNVVPKISWGGPCVTKNVHITGDLTPVVLIFRATRYVECTQASRNGWRHRRPIKFDSFNYDTTSSKNTQLVSNDREVLGSLYVLWWNSLSQCRSYWTCSCRCHGCQRSSSGGVRQTTNPVVDSFVCSTVCKVIVADRHQEYS